MSGLAKRWALMLPMAAIFLAGMCDSAPGQGADGGEFDGAVWRFSMTPKARGAEPLRGQFRVSNHVLYQKDTPEDEEFSKQIGKNFPNPKQKRTRVVFEDLRGVDRSRTWHMGIKGKVVMTFDRAGEWSGRMVDSEGRHWDFKCSRVQE